MAPTMLSLYTKKEFEVTVSFCESVLRAWKENKQRILINFANTDFITAPAQLYLHSKFATLRRTTGNRTVISRMRADNDLSHLLDQTGFLRESYTGLDTGYNVQDVLPITSSTHQKVKKVVEMMDNTFYGGTLDESPETKALVHTAVSEAMLNVIQHAYPNEKDSIVRKIGKRWWIIGQKIGSQLYLAFCDNGHGIPKTLPANDRWEQFRLVASRFVGKGADCSLIKAAMEIGRSRSEASGRGEGLYQILEYVLNNPRGTLWVFSNRGVYSYNSETGDETFRESKRSISGTLIQWNVSVTVES